jgi:hypothetical protein
MRQSHFRIGAVAGSATLIGAMAASLASACATAALPLVSDDASTGAPADATSDTSACPDASTSSDPKNCGGCGHACASGQVCSSGVCKAECTAPAVKCPGEPLCVNLTSDPKHCGACATVCAVGDAGALDPGNGNPDAGVPFDAGPDAGAPWDLGSPACVQSKCGIACSGGKLDCSGVCFDVQQNHDHCGDCSTACAFDEWCGGGHCCPTGKAFCGGACVDVLTDAANCGGCGIACSGQTPNCSAGLCIAGLSIEVEGHANVVVNCKAGDYNCEAQQVCNQVTNSVCVWQQYDCAYGTKGSWYPPDGQSGSSAFNFAYDYDFYNGTYGNICACTQSQMNKYGLAATHQYCGVGHWTRQ